MSDGLQMQQHYYDEHKHVALYITCQAQNVYKDVGVDVTT